MPSSRPKGQLIPPPRYIIYEYDMVLGIREMPVEVVGHEEALKKAKEIARYWCEDENPTVSLPDGRGHITVCGDSDFGALICPVS